MRAIRDGRSVVVVPARPAPLVRLQDLERGRDEIDDLLDDVFGKPDDRGPGAVDAVLVAGGLGTVIGAQAASLPTVFTVGGAVAVALGAVLPLRSVWRRVTAARHARRLRSILGDGMLLRVDHPHVAQLLAAHERLLSASASLADAQRARVQGIAHAALLEVASLLGGRLPGPQDEIDYVTVRTRALEELVAAVTDPRIADGDHDRRRALVEARREIEQLAGGSSVTDAATLARELRDPDDS